jgi:hypothetical protein
MVLQATGETTPVYDQSGTLHYVPVMKQNMILLFVNPLFASGFTIFSLIYSIIAEFFGTKPPTIEELRARQTYLEETSTIMENIQQLEGMHKRKGLIQSTKEKALEIKSALKEVTKQEETHQEYADNQERKSSQMVCLTGQEKCEASVRQAFGKQEESSEKQERHFRGMHEAKIITYYYAKAASWLSTGGSTVSLQTVAVTMNLSMKMLHNRVERKQIRATKNKTIVYKDSVIAWAISEIIPKERAKENAKQDYIYAHRNAEETAEHTLDITQANAHNHLQTSDES